MTSELVTLRTVAADSLSSADAGSIDSEGAQADAIQADIIVDNDGALLDTAQSASDAGGAPDAGSDDAGSDDAGAFDILTTDGDGGAPSADSQEGEDAGAPPAQDPRVHLFATTLGQCAVVDGTVWIRGGPQNLQFKPALGPPQLGFVAQSAWCPNPDSTLVVTGNDVAGTVRIAQLVKPKAPLLQFSAGQGVGLAVHGRETPFDVTVVGRASGSGQVVALGASSIFATKKVWGAPRGLAGLPPLQSVFVRADGVRVAVGGLGTIVRSTDGGSFKKETTPSNLILHGVWSAPTGPFFAVGAGGTLLRDGPAGWKIAPSNVLPGVNWRAIAGYDDGVALAAGGKQVALWYLNKWTTVNQITGLQPSGAPFSAIACYTKGPKRMVLLGRHPVVQQCTLDLAKPPQLNCQPGAVINGGKGGPP